MRPKVKTMTELTDDGGREAGNVNFEKETLRERIQRNDPSAMHQIFEQHREELIRIISIQLRSYRLGFRGGTGQVDFRSEVNSVFNIVFSKFIEQLQKPDNSLDESMYLRYMIKIAKNILNERKRKQNTEKNKGDESLNLIADQKMAPLDQVSNEESVLKFWTAVSDLSPVYRQIIEMRVRDELGYAEIGLKLGMQANVVRARYHDCMKEIRSKLNG